MRSTRKQRVRATAPGESAVIDTFMDLYVAWRERAGDVDVAYRRWGLAGSAAERRTAFAAFARALEDEDGAARSFREFASYAVLMLSV